MDRTAEGVVMSIHKRAHTSNRRAFKQVKRLFMIAGIVESNVKTQRQNQTTRSKVRLSVSVPSLDYSELESIASKQKVSVAWVIRDAIDNYLNSRENLASNRVSNTNKKK